MTTHVLILCTHNSARSVLAEAMLNHWAKKLGRDVQAHSAGSAPSGRINPLAIEALQHAGIDTAGCRSKSWDEFGRDGAPAWGLMVLSPGDMPSRRRLLERGGERERCVELARLLALLGGERQHALGRDRPALGELLDIEAEPRQPRGLDLLVGR